MTDGDSISVALSKENATINCKGDDNIISTKLYWGHEHDMKNLMDLMISNSDEDCYRADVVMASDVRTFVLSFMYI